MTFDPNTFMQQTVDAPMATEYELCPEGEFQAMIGNFDSESLFSSGTYNDKKTGEEKEWVRWRLPFVIQDPTVLAKMERESVTVPADDFLDLKNGLPDTGKGKNVLLGKIRDAVKQNQAGWNFQMLQGAGPLLVRVKHVTGNDDVKRAKVINAAPIR